MTSLTFSRVVVKLAAGLFLLTEIGGANAALTTGPATSDLRSAIDTGPIDQFVAKQTAPKVRVAPNCGTYCTMPKWFAPAPRFVPPPRLVPAPRFVPPHRVVLPIDTGSTHKSAHDDRACNNTAMLLRHLREYVPVCVPS